MEHAMNDLSSGFYTIQEASALIALDVAGFTTRAGRAYFHDTKLYSAAVQSERSVDGKVRDISFLDLIELRFIAHFRNLGVTSQALRRVSETARDIFGERPFARNDIKWRTDGQRLFVEAANETSDRRLLELSQRQYQIGFIVEEFLLKGVDWRADKYAQSWKPRLKEYDQIIVDPRVSFGEPSLENYGTGVRTLFDAWVAESGDHQAVAEWYEIPAELVQQAIAFHQELPYH